MDREWTEPLPIYAWLIEHPEGLIVVDTGETARAGEPGYFPRWHPYFKLAVREWVQPEDEIGPRLRALGFSPDDVRWVILTHLHTDHAGGLAHFPRSDTWDADSLDVVGDPLAAGDRVVVRAIWRTVGRGPDTDMEMAWVYTLRRGLIVRAEFFQDHAEALDAAGLQQ